MNRPSRTCAYRYASRGLTLLEVVVAMTVLAIGIAGVLRAISTCIASSNAAESYSTGVILAQQVAFEFERNTSLEQGHLNGTFDDPSAVGYRWEAEVEQQDANGLRPVTITVLWGPQSHQQHYGLKTFLRPPVDTTTEKTAATSPAPTPGAGP